MARKIAINGFGRIGRAVFRRFVEIGSLSEVVALNDLAPPEVLAYLLLHDSTHGPFSHAVSVDGNFLVIEGHRIAVLQQKDPSSLDWRSFAVDLVVESTGHLTSQTDAKVHIDRGAKAVLISAPAKETPSLVWGVNHKNVSLTDHKIFSSVSCTTNCASPVLAVLDHAFGIESCSLSTIHSLTVSQALLDGPSRKNFRLGRGAFQNIIPTSTGASNAVEEVLPQLKGRLTGSSFRIPLPDVSLLDLVLLFRRPASLSHVIEVLRKASCEDYKGVISVTDELVVSTDIRGNTHSCIVDCDASSEVKGSFVKIVAWYDNEIGYSARVVDLAQFICDRC